LVSKTSSAVELSIVTSCPEKGSDILNTLISHYNRNVIDEKNYVANNTIAFINDRLEIISDELKVAESDVEIFRKTQGITDLQAQGQLLLTSSSDYDKKINEVEIQLSILRQIKSFLMTPGNTGDGIPANVGLTDPTILSLIKAYNEEIMIRDRELSSLTANNPIRKESEDRIVMLKTNLLQGIGISENGMMLTIKELRGQENFYLGKALGLSSQERKARELLRQQNIKETLFIYLLQKKEETGLSLVTATPNAKIVDPAIYGTIPISPKRNIIMLAALMLGLVIPFAIVYVKDLFDNKIHNKEDVTRIVKAPFLAEIPTTKTDPLPVLKIRSSAAEKFRILTSNLEFVVGSQKTKIISVTSATAGDGKSFVSRNLALSLATSGKKTLLIDLDLRKSVMNKTFNLKTEAGSAMFLSDSHLQIENIIESKFWHDNLDVIPVKVYPPNPAELLASDRLTQLFKAVADNYEYIIVDTAPVGLVADVFHINRFVNATIYVTKVDYTFKQSLQDVQELYRDKKLTQLCCVLNGTTSSRRYGYNYESENYYIDDDKAIASSSADTMSKKKRKKRHEN
jgi:capsular exopolysaccharide synthesis family protein